MSSSWEAPWLRRLRTNSTEILISRTMGFPLKTSGREVIHFSSSFFPVVMVLSHAGVNLSFAYYSIRAFGTNRSVLGDDCITRRY